VLAGVGPYVMLFIKDFNNVAAWKGEVQKVLDHLRQTKRSIPFYIVTADATTAQAVFPGYTILKCDATVIKTAARVTPTFLVMDKDLVLSKHSYADVEPLLQLQ
jgi:hypothetical protein